MKHLSTLFLFLLVTGFFPHLSALPEAHARQQPQPDSTKQLPVPIDPEDEDDVFRTSDQEGERQVRRPGKRTGKGNRIGAICMDDSETDKTGAGACSGKGGVKLWKVEHVNEYGAREVYMVPSERYKIILEGREAGLPTTRVPEAAIPLNLFLQFAALLVVCLTIIYIVRRIFR